MVATVTAMVKVPLALTFKMKTSERNLYHKVVCPGAQTEPTHCPHLI